MNTLISPGIFNVFGSDCEVPFCSWALLLPSHFSCQTGLWWHCGFWEFFACRTNSWESQRWSLCVRGGVSGGLGHLPWCQDACWGSQGFCSAGTFGPVVPEQLWVCRCWSGKKVCVLLVMDVWLFAVSFVGCCPNRKANILRVCRTDNEWAICFRVPLNQALDLSV